jgi:hypothetical protein
MAAERDNDSNNNGNNNDFLPRTSRMAAETDNNNGNNNKGDGTADERAGATAPLG